MKKITALLIVFWANLYIMASTDNKEIERHMVRASEAFKINLFQDAINEYKAILLINPNYATAYYNLAVTEEKIGTSEALTEAMSNYKKYLQFCTDKSETALVEKKIYELEFKLEQKAKAKNWIQKFSGIWRSSWYDEEKGEPAWFLNLEPIGDDLRINVMPNCLFYSNYFRYKTITIPMPSDGSTFTFHFTYDSKYIPSNIESQMGHSVADVVSSNMTGVEGAIVGSLLHGFASGTEKQPYQTLTNYLFKLYTEGDLIKGTLQVVERRIDATYNRIIVDSVYTIEFNKSSQNYAAMDKIDLKLKHRREQGMISLGVFHSIPFGSTASTNVNSDQSGYMKNGYGIRFSLGEDYFEAAKKNRLSKKPVLFPYMDLEMSFNRIEAPYNLVTTTLNDEYDEYDAINVAYHVEKTNVGTGSTTGLALKLIDMKFGFFTTYQLGNNLFFSPMFEPFNLSPLNILITDSEEIPSWLTFDYSMRAEARISLMTKGMSYHNFSFSLDAGTTLFGTTIAKSDYHENITENANIYAKEPPQVWKLFFNIGYQFSF
jgi:tetratricopeptide (TPR) repeat protein